MANNSWLILLIASKKKDLLFIKHLMNLMLKRLLGHLNLFYIQLKFIIV